MNSDIPELHDLYFPCLDVAGAAADAGGPTNTLLFVGGATDGLKCSLGPAAGGAVGYLAAIHILALSIGPFLQQAPMAQLALRLALLLYLAW